MSTYGIKRDNYVNAKVEINRGRKDVNNLCKLVDSEERKGRPLPSPHFAFSMQFSDAVSSVSEILDPLDKKG